MMKLIPLARGSKSPLAGEDWHNRISDDPKEHARWLAQGLNQGLPLAENGRVVVDFDRDIEAAREHWKMTLCNCIVQTKKGFHFYYSGTTNTRKFEHGDIKGNGYTVYPPSKVKGHEYVFVKDGGLVPFQESWFPIVETRELVSNVLRGESYIMHIFAKSGERGHNTTYRAACKLRDSGMDEVSALAAMVEWNKTNAEPAWTTKELLHKVRSAFKRGKK
jgi:hypothetical protein